MRAAAFALSVWEPGAMGNSLKPESSASGMNSFTPSPS